MSRGAGRCAISARGGSAAGTALVGDVGVPAGGAAFASAVGKIAAGLTAGLGGIRAGRRLKPALVVGGLGGAQVVVGTAAGVVAEATHVDVGAALRAVAGAGALAVEELEADAGLDVSRGHHCRMYSTTPIRGWVHLRIAATQKNTPTRFGFKASPLVVEES